MRGLLSLAVLMMFSSCVSYSDLRPMYPEVGHPVYHVITVESLRPTLRWQASPKAKEGYDLVVYEGPETFFAYMERGEHTTVYAREGIQQTEHALETPLQPDRYYLWSVREHTAAGTADWSKYTYSSALPVPPFFWWTSGQLFRFKTPVSAVTATH